MATEPTAEAVYYFNLTQVTVYPGIMIHLDKFHVPSPHACSMMYTIRYNSCSLHACTIMDVFGHSSCSPHVG